MVFQANNIEIFRSQIYLWQQMPIRFHHFFCFVPKGAPQMDELVRMGLNEGPPNRHPGQGTANRRIFFENGMIELIWAEDEVELQSPSISPTRLWERSRWRATGYSPFGIAVTSAASAAKMAPPFAGWDYRPGYLPAGISILNATQPAHEPMIFCLSGARPFERVEHPGGARKIRKITVALTGSPISEAVRALAGLPEIELITGSTPSAVIELDNGAQFRLPA